jgi:hypothetical protein
VEGVMEKMRNVFTLLFFLIFINDLAAQMPGGRVFSKLPYVTVSNYQSFRPFPETNLSDSNICRLKKISRITSYYGKERWNEKFYDTLGRFMKEVGYYNDNGDTIIESIRTGLYNPTEEIYSDSEMSNGWIRYRTTIINKTKGTELEMVNSFSRNEIKNSSNSFRDSSITFYEHGNLMYFKKYVNGELKYWSYRKYYSNGKLRYAEDKDYKEKNIQHFDASGRLIKEEWIEEDFWTEQDALTRQINNYYYLKKVLHCKVEHDFKYDKIDSTVFFYNTSDSLVKRICWHKFNGRKGFWKEKELRKYDNKLRVVRIDVTKAYPYDTDTSIVVFKYKNQGKNYVGYSFWKYYFSEPQIWKSEITFDGDTITETYYEKKGKATSNSFCNDSMYQPNKKLVHFHGELLEESVFQKNKWHVAYLAKIDSFGRITDNYEGGFWEYDSLPDRYYHGHFEYNSQGKYIRAIVQSDTDSVMIDRRLVYNSQEQVLVVAEKGFTSSYDSLQYDSLGRLEYEFFKEDGKVREFFYEIDSTTSFISKCTRRTNGKETIMWNFQMKNGLPVSVKGTMEVNGTDIDFSNHWEYSYYK